MRTRARTLPHVRTRAGTSAAPPPRRVRWVVWGGPLGFGSELFVKTRTVVLSQCGRQRRGVYVRLLSPLQETLEGIRKFIPHPHTKPVENTPDGRPPIQPSSCLGWSAGT